MAAPASGLHDARRIYRHDGVPAMRSPELLRRAEAVA